MRPPIAFAGSTPTRDGRASIKGTSRAQALSLSSADWSDRANASLVTVAPEIT